MALVGHLRNNKVAYGAHLVEAMDQALKETSPRIQLRTLKDFMDQSKETSVTEQQDGKQYVLTFSRESLDGQSEEVVARVQGYVVGTSLPPIRQNMVPRNPSRIINMKQTVTVSGLGTAMFDDAVKGMIVVYQAFAAAITARGAQLRPWEPFREGGDLVLTFGNRYFTRSKDCGNEPAVELADIVDPFNVLRPLLKSELHIQDNVVEYWERGVTNTGWTKFSRVKPDRFMVTHLVELQVSFTAIKITRQEYAFVPKLRAICLLDRVVEKEYNAIVVNNLFSQPRSPLKKAKRKVGYAHEEQLEEDAPDVAMKKLRLDDDMKSVNKECNDAQMIQDSHM